MAYINGKEILFSSTIIAKAYPTGEEHVQFTNAVYSGTYPRMKVKTTNTDLNNFSMAVYDIAFSKLNGLGLVFATNYAYDGVGFSVSYIDGKIILHLLGGRDYSSTGEIDSTYCLGFVEINYRTSFDLSISTDGSKILFSINGQHLGEYAVVDNICSICGKSFDITTAKIGLVPCYHFPVKEGEKYALDFGSRALKNGEGIYFNYFYSAT